MVILSGIHGDGKTSLNGSSPNLSVKFLYISLEKSSFACDILASDMDGIPEGHVLKSQSPLYTNIIIPAPT
jgi:hypothetical protein